jgi:hypothetical protein
MDFNGLRIGTDTIDGAARLDVNVAVILVVDLNFNAWLNRQRFTRKNNNRTIDYIRASAQRPSCVLVDAAGYVGLCEA